VAPKTVSGDTTTNGQRKGVPNSWNGNSEAARTETCADTGNKQRFSILESIFVCAWCRLDRLSALCVLCRRYEMKSLSETMAELLYYELKIVRELRPWLLESWSWNSAQMLNIRATFHENGTCRVREITNKRTNQPTNSSEDYLLAELIIITRKFS